MNKDGVNEVVELVVEILNDHSEHGRSITIQQACELAYCILPDIWLYVAMWNTRSEYQKQFARMQQLYAHQQGRKEDVTPTV